MFAFDIHPPALKKLPINWFDAVVIVVLLFGFYRGRKNGMSRELLPVLKWLTLVVVCGFGYAPLAKTFSVPAQLDIFESDVLAYLLLALAVFFIFSVLKAKLEQRLIDREWFRNTEYYYGMGAGVIRCACLLLAALALLNARHFTSEDIENHEAYVQKWYGSDYFPSLMSVQQQVFQQSFTGPRIKNYLGALLINSVPPPAKPKMQLAPPA